MSLRLLLVRHGRSPAIEARAPAPPDLDVTPEGRRAVTAVAQLLGPTPMDLVMTSPARRCRQTAALAGFPDAPSGRPWGPVEGDANRHVVQALRGCGPGPRDATSAMDALASELRELDAAIDVLKRSIRGSVLVFTHAEIIAYVLHRWLGAEFRAAHTADPASLTVIDFGETPKLRMFNAGALGPGLVGGDGLSRRH